MKSRILKKVLLYFLLILLIFALLMGLLFFRLGQKSINEASLKMAEDRAKNIASSLTSFLYSDPFIDFNPVQQSDTEAEKETGSIQGKGQSKGNRPHPQGDNDRHNQKTYGQGYRFIAWMNTLLSTNINIVVETENQALPLNIETLIKSELAAKERDMAEMALQGETVSILAGNIGREDTSILTATPLYSAEGHITACLLLKESANDSPALRTEAQRLFIISVGIAALFVFVLAIFLTRQLLKPLRRIQHVTQELSAGEYDVRTKISQRDELGDLAKDVDVLALRLEEAKQESAYLDRLRNDFISSMSHELKTPVTVIKSSTEALQQGLIADETRQTYYDVLYQEICLLERLIQDLTDLNVLRNEKYPLQQDELNVFDVLRDAVRSQRLLALDKNITLEENISEETLYIQGDYARIRQMFVIVLNNAIKYSSPTKQVQIDYDSHDRVLIITNWGKELGTESLGRIFEPFYRDKNTKEKGVGLGLSIAKEIADRHNIVIDVKSDAGGTSFSFCFKDNGKN